MIPMPEGLEYYTADVVAECFNYGKRLPAEYGGWQVLHAKLWGFLADAQNPTPLGGDGSNGTVETPCGQLSLNNDDKAGHWWTRLTEVEQAAIAAAYEEMRGWSDEAVRRAWESKMDAHARKLTDVRSWTWEKSEEGGD